MGLPRGTRSRSPLMGEIRPIRLMEVEFIARTRITLFLLAAFLIKRSLSARPVTAEKLDANGVNRAKVGSPTWASHFDVSRVTRS